ncbi:MAG: UbiA family prenyltransferase [Desulfobulbaceae bacterium]|nr:UbiA family prenyltransferase [Desulfobulbaceae bacterium]
MRKSVKRDSPPAFREPPGSPAGLNNFGAIRLFGEIGNYLTLCRVSNLPTVWTNVLASLVLTGEAYSIPVFLLLCLSLSLFYSGGMCLNDVLDAKEDRLKKAFRPIPAGKISLRNGAVFASGLLGSGLILLLAAPFNRAVLPGLLLLVFIGAYNILHRQYRAGILLMASCRLMIFVIAAAAAAGTVGNIVLLGGAVQFLYILLVSAAARLEKQSNQYAYPPIPLMIAGISLLDGMLMAAVASPAWLLAGLAGGALTLFGQKFVRGD